MRCIGLVVLMAVSVMAMAMAGEPGTYRVERGVQIPLSLMNDVSTRNAIPGDAIYLGTTFPVVAGGRVAIPPGSWVTGTITEVRRARHGQRRGELHVRFDSLLLTNGVSRALRGDLGAHPAVGPERAIKPLRLMRSPGPASPERRLVRSLNLRQEASGIPERSAGLRRARG